MALAVLALPLVLVVAFSFEWIQENMFSVDNRQRGSVLSNSSLPGLFHENIFKML
jgi:hypothetical protein